MSTKDVDIDQVGAKMRADFDEMVDETEGALFRAAIKGVRPVVEDTPTDRGQAKAGWDARRAKGGADLYNDVPYVGVLEAGSRPHRPPLWPILEWVVRQFGLNLEVLGAQENEEQSKAIQGATQHVPGNDLDNVPWPTYRLAESICDKIEREGTEPHWMVKNNLDELNRIAKKEVEKALGKL